MENFFFTARNIEDYLAPLNKVAKKNLTDENLLDDKDVQDILFAIVKSQLDDDNWLTMPISDAVNTGLQDVKLDFNLGLRLEVPAGNWHAKIFDFDSGEIVFDKDISDVRLHSLDSYYINWHVELFLGGEKVFTHTFNAEGKSVLIYFPRIGIGDILAMLPYAEEFRRRNKCQVFVIMRNDLRELAAYLYPELLQTEQILIDVNYATYRMIMPTNILPIWPADVRNYPIERIAEVALGVPKLLNTPRFEPIDPPVTKDPYVCISVQASMVRKGWLYPNGWDIVVNYLKSLGYRVFCIDRDVECKDDELNLVNRKPDDAEDFTGNFSLIERANMLYYADFFIGLSSGLAWIADAVNCPVVMICGFSKDWSEFYTPYRVSNRLVCNGCVNDGCYNYVKDTCPRHKGTPREFECQKKISPRQVIDAIERLIIDEQLTPPILKN